MKHSFEVGDRAVYPVHGVGEVIKIESLELGGTLMKVYVLKVLSSGLTIRVPCANAEQVGLRKVISEPEVSEVYAVLRSKQIGTDTQTWNRRYREYMTKIKTGSCYEVAEVMRDLARLRDSKDLSFGERRMLETARGLLVRELALAKDLSEPSIEQELDEIFSEPIAA